MIKRLSHIGIAVRDIDKSLKFYRDMLGLECGEVKRFENMGIMIAFVKLGETELELLQSIQEGSVIAKFIEKRGEGIHHLSFEVDDIEQTLTDLKNGGIELIDEKPRIGASGKKVAFINPRSTYGVLIELEARDA
ncbi:MAG: methylmalonyl-CoA epimerase [candidate division WOR-3 bacterium]